MPSLNSMPQSILFVCLGNICRSPTAHGVFAQMLHDAGLHKHITVDSAGTGAYHVGNKPDSRMMKAAKKRGFDLSYLRARAVQQSDFSDFDLILAMDDVNYSDLIEICPTDYKHKLKMFLSFARSSSVESVPDPYYGGADGFEEVLDLVEDACTEILKNIL